MIFKVRRFCATAASNKLAVVFQNWHQYSYIDTIYIRKDNAKYRVNGRVWTPVCIWYRTRLIWYPSEIGFVVAIVWNLCNAVQLCTCIWLHITLGVHETPRGAPWVSGLVGHFVPTWPDSECSHTVQCSDCSNWIDVVIVITCFGTVWPFWCWCAVKLW